MTFATWAGRVARSEAVHGWFMRMTSAYYGARAEQISALEALCKLKYCGGPIFMSDVETGGQSTHLVGSAAVSEGMMAELEHVELSSPVRKVEWSENRVVVTTDRGTSSARYLVCAVSPAMASQIQFDPPLPAIRRQLHQRFPSGRYTKVVMIYDRPFWREKNLNGNVIATDGSLTSLYDMGDETTERPIIAGLFGGVAAQGIDELSPQDRRSRVLGLASRALGPEAAKPEAYHEQIGANEEWSAGASSRFMVPGVISTFGSQIRASTGPIHWAGVHMAREYRGYMEGALIAGEDAAKAILSLEA
nr:MULTISPECIES: FAD-dependent oxidoreductase [unclassified Mesorhizobium]